MNSFQTKALFAISALGHHIPSNKLEEMLGSDTIKGLLKKGVITKEVINRKTWLVPSFLGNRIIDKVCSLTDLIP